MNFNEISGVSWQGWFSVKIDLKNIETSPINQALSIRITSGDSPLIPNNKGNNSSKL